MTIPINVLTKCKQQHYTQWLTGANMQQTAEHRQTEKGCEHKTHCMLEMLQAPKHTRDKHWGA